MPNLRSTDNKRKSDTVIVDNAKARKVTSRTETDRNVKVPIASQFKSLKEAYEILNKENIENLKVIEDLNYNLHYLYTLNLWRQKKTTNSKSYIVSPNIMAPI